jgi:Undecaprenyl-phosphate galactose phosphotransferase WbaP
MTYETFAAGQTARKNYGLWPMVGIFLLGDLAAVMLSFGTGFFIENLFNPDGIDFKSFVTYWPYLPAFIIVLSILSLYPGISLAHAEELRRFSIASFLSHAGIILSLFIRNRYLDPYSIAFGISWVASIPMFMSERGILRRMFVKTKFWGIPVAIFGAGKTGRMVVDTLLERPRIGYKPVVILDDDPNLIGEYKGVPILAGTALGTRLVEECGIDTALIAMPGVERVRLATIVAEHARSFRHYVIIPDLIGVASLWMSVRDFDGMLGLYTDQQLLIPANVAIKRFIDLTICFLGGIIAFPFMAILALLIVLDSPGRAFYKHTRLGMNGKPIKVLKFRSMYKNSDEMLAKLLAEDPGAKVEWESNFKLKNDPRITRMGKFLRRTSLDELPQVLNVIKGEMSLIGPRPIVDDEVEKYGHHYKLFSSVKPGLSGLWQVSGRSETDYEERIALDVFYIQSWSLWLDLYILLKTIVVVFRGKGAY